MLPAQVKLAMFDGSCLPIIIHMVPLALPYPWWWSRELGPCMWLCLAAQHFLNSVPNLPRSVNGIVGTGRGYETPPPPSPKYYLDKCLLLHIKLNYV